MVQWRITRITYHPRVLLKEIIQHLNPVFAFGFHNNDATFRDYASPKLECDVWFPLPPSLLLNCPEALGLSLESSRVPIRDFPQDMFVHNNDREDMRQMTINLAAGVGSGNSSRQ